MTDDFEELIRTAGRGLGTAGETPTYHDSWKRGQRRRFVKRAAMTAVGACALVVAFTADVAQLDQFGDRSIEVADIPTNAIEITPTWVVPTTAPLEPTPSVADDATAPTLGLPAAPSVAGADSEDERGSREAGIADDDQDPDEPPATAASAIPQAPAESVSSVEVVIPTATPMPVVPPTPPRAGTQIEFPTAIPTAAPFANDSGGTSKQPGSGDAVFGPAVDEQGSGGTGTAPVPVPAPTSTPDPTSTSTRTPAPEDPAAAAPAPVPAQERATATATPAENGLLQLPVDAVVLGEVGTADGVYACDTDFDGVEDAECELLVSYPCSFESEAVQGVVAIDSDGDGAIDRCVPTGDTWCRVSLGGERTRQACVIFGGRP